LYFLVFFFISHGEACLSRYRVRCNSLRLATNWPFLFFSFLFFSSPQFLHWSSKISKFHKIVSIYFFIWFDFYFYNYFLKFKFLNFFFFNFTIFKFFNILDFIFIFWLPCVLFEIIFIIDVFYYFILYFLLSFLCFDKSFKLIYFFNFIIQH